MTDPVLVRANKTLSALQSDDPKVQRALQVLGDAIKVGNISGSTGVAIGRNIRMVVNQFPDLTAKQVAQLLELRSALMGPDAEKHRLASILIDKTTDFTGREHVFQAINEFLDNHSSGYLIIEGEPGLGKSAILAEYVKRTNCIAHFTMRSQGIVRASQFLENVCAQIIADRGLPYVALPADATQDGAFLEKLLREAMEAQPGERLVIAVDALNEADPASQGGCSNLLCLPPVLPEGVYFIMTKRSDEIVLVVQAPQERLDLMAFPAENRSDVERYLERCAQRPKVQAWIERQKKPTAAAFVQDLADLSENNFMYLRYVVAEIERGRYQDLSFEKLPFGLEGYYKDQWQRMGMRSQDRRYEESKLMLGLIAVAQGEGLSRAQIEGITGKEAWHALRVWQEYLVGELPDGPFRIYHKSFADFLLQDKDSIDSASCHSLIVDHYLGLLGA